MNQQDRLQEWRDADLDARLEKVQNLVESLSEPKPHELGIWLALCLGKELRDGIALGQLSGALVLQWMAKYPESLIEEAIVFARQIVLKPADLVQRIEARLRENTAEPVSAVEDHDDAE